MKATGRKRKDEFPAEIKRILISDKAVLIMDSIRFAEDDEESWTRLSVGIRQLYILTKNGHHWLVERADIRQLLREVWRSPALRSRLRNVTVHHHETWDLSVKFLILLMVHVRTNPDDLDALFELTSHNNKSISEASRWRQFIENFILVLSSSPARRRAMISKWLELVKTRAFTDEHLAEISQWVIQPLLKQLSTQPNAELVIYDSVKTEQPNRPSGNIINLVDQDVLENESLYNVSDVLRVVILKLFVLFTESGERFFPEQPNPPPQDQLLARFSLIECNFLQKRELDHIQIDVGTVIQCQSLSAQVSSKYSIPNRFYQTIMKILFASGGVEPRGANKAAIDILLPNLLAKNADGAEKLCLYIRRCVTDGILSVSSNNSMIFHSILRHCVPLFPFRHSFIKIFIANDHKNGLSNSSSLKLKKTSLEMAECLVHWEAMHKRVEFNLMETVNENAASEVIRPRRPGSPSGREDKDMEQRDVDNLANILMRLSFVFGDTNNTDSFGRRCMKLLKFSMRKDMHPMADLRLSWLDKVLGTVDQIKMPVGETNTPSQIPSICLALKTLTYFIPLLQWCSVLPIIQEMSNNLVKVATCDNAGVGKCMHQLISMFCCTWPGYPLLRNLPAPLDPLYAQIIKVIHEGLSEYERSRSSHQTQIFCTLMLLKATIPHVPSVLDRLLSLLVTVVKKVCDEHMASVMKQQTQQPAPGSGGVVSAELVVIILDIVKVSQVLDPSPIRRQNVLSITMDFTGLGSDVHVYRALIHIFNDWLPLSGKYDKDSSKPAAKFPRDSKKEKEEKVKEGELDFPRRPSPVPVEDTQSMTPRELGVLILKFHLQLERRFSDDFEIQEMYTSRIHNIHISDGPRLEEQKQRLLNTYMYGLCHSNPEWRAKFHAIHDQQAARSVYDHLLNIFNGINWDACTLTYYVGFCLNSSLGFATNANSQLQLLDIKLTVPVTATPTDNSGSGSTEPALKQEENGVEQGQDLLDTSSMEISPDELRRVEELSVEAIAQRVYELNDLTKGNMTKCMLDGIFQLCHVRNQFATDLWIPVLPQLWKLFTAEQRDSLLAPFKSFLMTHIHQAQRDLVHSPIQAMFDAMIRCEGVQLKLQPMSVLFLGDRQNLWYRSVFLLEEMSISPKLDVANQKSVIKASQMQMPIEMDSTAEINQLIHGVLWGAEESLARMYMAVGEDGFSGADWHLRGTIQPKSEPTVMRPMQDFRTAIGYEREGISSAAKESYENAMDAFLAEYDDKPVPDSGFGELQVLTGRYTGIPKQLNQCPALYNLAITETINNRHPASSKTPMRFRASLNLAGFHFYAVKSDKSARTLPVVPARLPQNWTEIYTGFTSGERFTDMMELPVGLGPQIAGLAEGQYFPVPRSLREFISENLPWDSETWPANISQYIDAIGLPRDEFLEDFNASVANLASASQAVRKRHCQIIQLDWICGYGLLNLLKFLGEVQSHVQGGEEATQTIMNRIGQLQRHNVQGFCWRSDTWRFTMNRRLTFANQQQHHHAHYNFLRKGMVLIIANENGPGFSLTRHRSYQVEKLVEVFVACGFVLYLDTVHWNLTADEMEQTSWNYAHDIRHNQHDVAVVCFLTHGRENGLLFGVDGLLVSRTTIEQQYEDVNCVELRDKAKLFIYNACRGDQTDSRLRLDPLIEPTTTMSDAFVMFSTTEGFISPAYSFGSYFIDALYYAASCHAHTHSIDFLAYLVNRRLREQETSDANEVPPCYYPLIGQSTSTLSRLLYLA